MTTYTSNGKLLLTAEYIVLDGAKALALPTKFGQSLTVKSIDKPQLLWRSIDYKGDVWFEANFPLEKIPSNFSNPHNEIEKRIVQILNAAKQLNPGFLSIDGGLSITTKLDFDKNWGLGSSSTLINNISNWANVDAYQLLKLTFGGSGYDIACAQNNQPITYQNNLPKNTRIVKLVEFNPTFKDNLFFVYLNQKQNSREGIKYYNANKHNVLNTINEIDLITERIMSCSSISEFETLIFRHEEIISKLINLPTIKSTIFSDYSGAIKSLGAWGGDFILVTGSPNDMNYFKEKGYQTIIAYCDMIL